MGRLTGFFGILWGGNPERCVGGRAEILRLYWVIGRKRSFPSRFSDALLRRRLGRAKWWERWKIENHGYIGSVADARSLLMGSAGYSSTVRGRNSDEAERREREVRDDDGNIFSFGIERMGVECSAAISNNLRWLQQ